MKHLALVPFLGLALLVAPHRSAADEDEMEPTPEQLVDALVQEHGVRRDGPGVGVLVVGPTGVLLKRAYGLANLKKKTPITAATTFDLASVSKHFTGAAVLLLVQRGKVGIQDDVRKHLPQLPLYDPEHPITVDHLSRHLSGLPDYLAWDVEPVAPRAYAGNADALAALARRKEASPLESAPGQTYAYSNTGYMVLGSLVERVSGLSFGAFLAKELFEPLGMKTAWVLESTRVPTVATAVGYTREDEVWKPTWSAPTPEHHEKELTVGDGGVWASLDDMLAWDGGLRAGKPLAMATLSAALTPGKTLDGTRVAYAMGWELQFGEADALLTLSHNGSWAGFQTYIGHDVGRELTVVVLSNHGGFDSEAFGEAVGALYRN